jgi:flavodoxin
MDGKKVALIYYSRTNNTKVAAEYIKDHLEQKTIQVDIIQILAQERPGFFKALNSARNQTILAIRNTDFDLSSYEMIILGMPIWAYYPAPFYKSFLAQVKDYQKKIYAIFISPGVSIKRNRISLDRFRDELKALGVDSIIAEMIILMRKKSVLECEPEIEQFISLIHRHL